MVLSPVGTLLFRADGTGVHDDGYLQLVWGDAEHLLHILGNSGVGRRGDPSYLGGGALMYDGQLELEYTCVSCHENTYPRRLAGGYCSDCIIGGMTPEELAAEDREHEQQRDDYRNRYLYDYARDVVNGKRTLKEAARSCYADLAEMEEAVEEIRREREEDDRAWREHLAYCAAERRAAHIHRALARGVAHKRKQRRTYV